MVFKELDSLSFLKKNNPYSLLWSQYWILCRMMQQINIFYNNKLIKSSFQVIDYFKLMIYPITSKRRKRNFTISLHFWIILQDILRNILYILKCSQILRKNSYWFAYDLPECHFLSNTILCLFLRIPFVFQQINRGLTLLIFFFKDNPIFLSFFKFIKKFQIVLNTK